MTDTKVKKIDGDEAESTVFMCCAGCCMIIFTVAFVAAIISYYVFGIIFLVQDIELCKKCDGSSLWAYVLTTLIIGACTGSSKANSKEEKKSPEQLLITLIIVFIINAGMGIWGGIELWGKSCDFLTESRIWTFGAVTFTLQMTASFFCVCYILALCCTLIAASAETKDAETKDGQDLTNIV